VSDFFGVIFAGRRGRRPLQSVHVLSTKRKALIKMDFPQ